MKLVSFGGSFLNVGFTPCRVRLGQVLPSFHVNTVHISFSKMYPWCLRKLSSTPVSQPILSRRWPTYNAISISCCYSPCRYTVVQSLPNAGLRLGKEVAE